MINALLIILMSALATCSSVCKSYFEVKPGYFWLLNEQEKTIFHNGGPDVGIEVGTDIFRYLRIGLEGRFFSKIGTAIKTCDINLYISGTQMYITNDTNRINCKNTRLKISSLTPWLKFILPAANGLRLYAGVGPQIQFVRLYSKIPFSIPCQHARVPASVYTLGFQYTYKHLLIDPFIQFQTGKAYFSQTITNPLSTRGIKVGCGIGYNF